MKKIIRPESRTYSIGRGGERSWGSFGIGAEIVVETDGYLWNFKVGDIFAQDGSLNFYEVLGFRNKEELWVRNTQTESIMYFESPRGLLLIARPGMKFQVGDRVKASWRGIFAGQTGVIAAIDPTPTSVVPYLINFERETEGGQTTEASWDKPWFPKSDKTLKKKYIWTSGERKEVMMKRVVLDKHGREIEVEMEGEMWGFKSDDVITNENGNENNRLVVQGFRNNALWVCNENGGSAELFLKPDGLLLVERPGLKYAVGDTVKITNGTGLDSVGIIAVIDPVAAEKELNNRPAYPYYVEIDFPDNNGENAGRMLKYVWYPKKNGNKKQIMCGEHEIKKWDKTAKEETDNDGKEEGQVWLRQISRSETTDNGGEEKWNVGEEWPEWMKKTALTVKAGVSHFFILWGNIHDPQKVGDKFIPLEQCLTDVLGRDGKIPAMFYSVSKGLYFPNSAAETRFRERYLGHTAETAKNQAASQSEAEKMAAAGKRAQQEAPLSEIIGKGPDKVFPFLEKFVLEEKSGPKILIVNFAHNAAPAETGAQDRYDRETIEMLEYWARDAKIREAGGVIILLTPHLVDIADGLRAPQSEVAAIKVPKPNEEERAERWKTLVENGETEVKDELNAQTLGRITNGLSIKNIDNVYALAKVKKTPLDLALIKNKKREILETEFSDDILRVTVPQFGFDYFGNMENVKKYMLEVRDNILKGPLRRVPMGMLASGPPGTGKTFFFECFAYECGFNFVKIVNPQEMFVGSSEKRMAKILSALDDVSPVIVVEDEADQSEAPRGSFVGDSGVSNRLRQMKFEFCSDPKRRGKLFWIRITNRPDLLDAAYKRKGRTDDHIAFIMPNAAACAKIFEAIIKRYQIPTTISDFSSFGEKTAEKIYCTGADIEWMALEADKIAGREGKEKVGKKHLLKMIESWKPKARPAIIDQQIILTLEEADEHLNPDGWEKALEDAYKRQFERSKASKR